MILKSITIENFGVFRGRSEFSLNSKMNDQDKKVVLIGGQNGGGKTTILEGIKLAFLGIHSIDKKISQNEYKDYLISRIHREINGNKPTNNSLMTSIEVQFSHTKIGMKSEYELKRSWKKIRGKLSEKVSLLKDGYEVSGIREEDIQDFLLELFPLGIAQLYFFSADKIDKLVNDAQYSYYLKNLVNSMLGLNLTQQLINDLEIYYRKQQREFLTEEFQQEIVVLEEKVTKNNNIITRLDLDTGRSLAQIERYERKIKEQERTIIEEGGSYAQRRQEILSEKNKVEVLLGDVENQIRASCANLLPFTIASPLLNKMKEQIIKEKKTQERRKINEVKKEIINEISQLTSNEGIWKAASENQVSFDGRKSIISNIKEYLNDTFIVSEKNEIDLVLIKDLPETTISKLLENIERSQTTTFKEFFIANKKAIDLRTLLQGLDAELLSVPSDDVLIPLLAELNELTEKLGRFRQTYDDIQSKIQTLHTEIEQFEKEILIIEEKIIDQKSRTGRLILVEKVQRVVNKYLIKLSEVKIKELEEKIVTCFNQLCRKDNLITRMTINSQTFEIELEDEQKKKFPKTDLSTGEKELFALSILWALIEITAREIPIIIDAPLGNLDRKHRKNLFEIFFKEASHQIILLSSDGEMQPSYYDDINPVVSHFLEINYDHSTKSSKVVQGIISEFIKQEEAN